MKPKNVMLLGFVNSAVDYLNRHMDEEPDTRLAELKNVDLASLKDELSDNLDASLGTMQSTMSTLLKAGNEAFDKFVEDTHSSGSAISNQFNNLFDIDLDNTRQTNQEELARLLSFYNLENDDEDNNVDNSDDELMQKIAKNVTSDDTSDIISSTETVKQEEGIDSIFNEIVENEDKPIIEETPVVEEQPVVEEAPVVEELKEIEIDEQQVKQDVQKQETQAYVSSLISDLREELVKEEEYKKQEENKKNEIFERISKLYPYLPEGFIRSVYELKEGLSTEYPIGDRIIVLHRVSFNDVEDLRKFVEIGLNHEYTINADENKKIVDIFKEFVNSDGRILTNIYEIANQGYLLNGNYEGYNVIVNED